MTYNPTLFSNKNYMKNFDSFNLLYFYSNYLLIFTNILSFYQGELIFIFVTSKKKITTSEIYQLAAVKQ
jgi:hypothetical protein